MSSPKKCAESFGNKFFTGFTSTGNSFAFEIKLNAGNYWYLRLILINELQSLLK